MSQAASVDDVTYPAYLVVRSVQFTDDARAELVGMRELRQRVCVHHQHT